MAIIITYMNKLEQLGFKIDPTIQIKDRKGLVLQDNTKVSIQKLLLLLDGLTQKESDEVFDKVTIPSKSMTGCLFRLNQFYGNYIDEFLTDDINAMSCKQDMNKLQKYINDYNYYNHVILEYQPLDLKIISDKNVECRRCCCITNIQCKKCYRYWCLYDFDHRNHYLYCNGGSKISDMRIYNDRGSML